MSTTSNSRADLRSAAAALLLLAACATTQPAADPEAPQPALAAPASRVAAAPPSDREMPIEVESAAVRPAAEMPEVLSRSRRKAEDARGLVVIEVRTTIDFGDEARTAYPAIVLNGQPLTQTLVLGPRHLAALVEREALRGEGTVSVTMIGDPRRTPQRPFTLRLP